MSRRQSLDRPGILSPPGPFLTPSPSPSISASPRLQPSPSLSPFPQDVLLITNNTITNTTQEQERKAATPGRRPSIHQLSASPNAGTVVFQPSPSQSPAAATTVIGVTGNEFNTTLVGSNNISLNKKGSKRTSQSYTAGYGQATSIVAAATLAASNLANSPKGTSKKATVLPSPIINSSNSPLLNDSPISSPSSVTSIKPPTPQPIIQQLPVMNAGNQLLQFIQGSQIITATPAATGNQHHLQQNQQHSKPQFITATANVQNTNSQTIGSSTTTNKSSRGPQQILPKPQTGGITNTSDKTPIIAHTTKTMTIQHTGQITQAPQHHSASPATPGPSITTNTNTSAAQTPSGQIILPTGNLNTQPLLLNQMPVIVQQNTQGVQFILRPPTPQLAAPSLVIHNTRPQLQQPQPQQLLRILNTNGTMQLATTPTFIVSSQANLIQQNLQTIKASTQTAAGTATPIAQLNNLQAAAAAAAAGPRSQQLAAAINSHIIGQSMAQLQNLQLNGNLAQIQMPNGLNGPIISQLPAQFQQNLGGFNQLNQNLNLNALNGANLQQIAAAAAAAGATFQSPPPPQVGEIQMPSVVSAQNIQFSTTNNNQLNAVGQSIGIASPAVTPQPQIIPSVTPEPVRNVTPVLQNIIGPQGTTTVLVQSDNLSGVTTSGNAISSAAPIHTAIKPNIMKMNQESQEIISTITPKPKKPTRSRKKKSQVLQQDFNIVHSSSSTITATTTTTSETSSPTMCSVTSSATTSPTSLSKNVTSTGKLDLANVMKLCGIMEDDDYMDADDPPIENQQEDQKMIVPSNSPQLQNQLYQPQHQIQSSQSSVTSSPVSSSTTHPSSSDIMIAIPSQSSDTPLTFTIPTSQCDNSKMMTSGRRNLISTSNSSSGINNSNDTIDIKNSTSLIEPQNIVIKIDQSESGQPFTISIPRIQTEDLQQSMFQIVPQHQQQQQQQSSQHGITFQGNTTGMVSQQNLSNIPPNSGIHQSNISMPSTSLSSSSTMNTVQNSTLQSKISSHSSSGTTSVPTITTSSNNNSSSNNILCVTSFVNSINSHSAPTLQSQINEIQNQLIGVNSSMAMTTPGGTSGSHAIISNASFSTGSITTSSTTSTIVPSTISTTTATVKPRRKPAVKRNGKKVEAISTSGGNVPSQIGNIQISQIDATKIANQNMPISSVIENKIQIMPILDNNKIVGPNNNQQAQNYQQQQQSLHHVPQTHLQTSSITNPTIAIQNNNLSQMSHVSQAGNSGNTTTIVSVPTSSMDLAVNNSNNAKLQTDSVNRNVQQQHLGGTTTTGLTQATITGNITLPIATNPAGTTLFPQLTGNLSLAFAEDGNRLILHHDPNSPQDHTSQIILQAILSGALPNITIVNETPDKNKIPKSNVTTSVNNSVVSVNQAIGSSAKVVNLPQSSSISNNSINNKNVSTINQNLTPTIQVNLHPSSLSLPHLTTGTTTSGLSNIQITPNIPNVIDMSGSTVIGSIPKRTNLVDNSRKNDSLTTASSIIQTNHQQQHQQQQTIVVNPNSAKVISLPKIDVNNQQLFCYNQITNQITQVNPSQTTAVVGPMERVLIAPAGINTQQLAQCMAQGQIHFHDIQAAQTSQIPTSSVSTLPSMTLAPSMPVTKIQQQIVHPQQHQPVQPLQSIQPLQQTKQVANVAPIIDASKAKVDPKPRKPKPRKPKICNENLAKNNSSTIKPMQKLDLNAKTNSNLIQIVQPTTAKDHNLLRNSSTCSGATFISTNTSVSSNIHPFQTQTGTTKLVGVTAPMQQNRNLSNNQNSVNNNNSNNSNSTSIATTTITTTSATTPTTFTLAASAVPISSIAASSSSNCNISSSGAPVYTSSSNSITSRPQNILSNSIPPLVSVSAAQAVPRVQTIQLTPQQQQLLQTVQMQIQQLSSKLQNKSLLATLNIPPDFDPNNPMNNKPLPSLHNIQNMSDSEIYTALRRLFIEQKKILASGKVIQTIPASHGAAFVPTPILQAQPQATISSNASGVSDVIPIALGNHIAFSSNINSMPSTTITTTAGSKSINTSGSISGIGGTTVQININNKNELQTIPANIVQPNNHNSTNNSVCTTQKIHIYPMQHQKQAQEQQQRILHQQENNIQQPSAHTNVQTSITQPKLVQQNQIIQHQQQNKQNFQQNQTKQQSHLRVQPHTQKPSPPEQQNKQQQQPQQTAKDLPSTTQLSQQQKLGGPSQPECQNIKKEPRSNPLPIQPPVTTQGQLQPQKRIQQTSHQQQPVPNLQQQSVPMITIKTETIDSNSNSSLEVKQPILLSSSYTPAALTSPRSKIARHDMFQRQLEVDQDGCSKPDYVTPFHSKYDAVKRLIRYHCMYQKDEETPLEEEEEYENIALNLQDKFKTLQLKFQKLLLQESMRLHPTSELCYINRLLLTDIQGELLDMRAEANQQTAAATVTSSTVSSTVASTSTIMASSTGSYQQTNNNAVVNVAGGNHHLSSYRYIKKENDLQVPTSMAVSQQQLNSQQTCVQANKHLNFHQEYKDHVNGQMVHQQQLSNSYNSNTVQNIRSTPSESNILKSEIKTEPNDIIFNNLKNELISSTRNRDNQANTNSFNSLSSTAKTCNDKKLTLNTASSHLNRNNNVNSSNLALTGNSQDVRIKDEKDNNLESYMSSTEPHLISGDKTESTTCNETSTTIITSTSSKVVLSNNSNSFQSCQVQRSSCALMQKQSMDSLMNMIGGNAGTSIKKELEHFDIESEITPSYILKKVEQPNASISMKDVENISKNQLNENIVSPETNLDNNSNEFNLDYFSTSENQHPNFAGNLSFVADDGLNQSLKDRKDEQLTNTSNKNEQYDEWLCIQKELSLITEKKQDSSMIIANHHHHHQHHTHNINEDINTNEEDECNSTSKSVEKHLSDIFGPPSPTKVVESQLSELFGDNNNMTTNGSTTTISTNPAVIKDHHNQQQQHQHSHHHPQQQQLVTNNIQLADLFNADSISSKSIETRLEAMFGESPVEKSGGDMVDDLFQDNSPSGVAPSSSTTMDGTHHTGVHQQQHHHNNSMQDNLQTYPLMTTAGTKRHWSNTNDLMPESNISSTSTINYGKRSCMVAEYMEESHITSNHPRWMMDQTFDFITTHPTSNMNSQGNDDSLESNLRKREWNGDIIVSGNTIEDHHSNVNNKKPCFGTKSSVSDHDLDAELLGLNTAPPDESSIANEIMQHHTASGIHASGNINGSGAVNLQAQNSSSNHQQYPHIHMNNIMNMQGVADASGNPINSHHHHSHHHSHHLQQQQMHQGGSTIMGSSACSGTNIFEANLNNSSANANLSGGSSNGGSISSNFDDDINRHVQNAIDSILNLQNSESDSLNFSLDHSMGSFLADDNSLGGGSTGGGGPGSNESQQHHHHHVQQQLHHHHHHSTSIIQQPQLVNSPHCMMSGATAITNNVTHHNPSSILVNNGAIIGGGGGGNNSGDMKPQRPHHGRIDDLGDCLLSSGGGDNSNLMVDSPSSVMSSATSSGGGVGGPGSNSSVMPAGIADFSCVASIDEAVKSIMTS